MLTRKPAKLTQLGVFGLVALPFAAAEATVIKDGTLHDVDPPPSIIVETSVADTGAIMRSTFDMVTEQEIRILDQRALKTFPAVVRDT